MMWEYTVSEQIETEYESYNGYTHKYDVPRHIMYHKIVRLGNTGNILEIVAEQTAEANTKLSKQIAKNFTTIVEAVNKEMVG